MPCGPAGVTLSFHRGMTRTTRFVTELEFEAAAMRVLHFSMTYRFKVLSVDGTRTVRITTLFDPES